MFHRLFRHLACYPRFAFAADERHQCRIGNCNWSELSNPLRDIVHPAEPYILFLAVFLASVNIFGGFYVSARMLNMFKQKGKKHD